MTYILMEQSQIINKQLFNENQSDQYIEYF